MPCRLPGCDGVIYRRTAQGRNRWFCKNRNCADLFHHRRHALDDALDELAQRYMEDGHTWRSRKDLESYIRYLLATRTAYFAPTDWATPQGDLLRGANATETRELVESWRYLARQPEHREVCPVCWGAGQLPSEPAPEPESEAARQQRVLSIAKAIHLLVSQLLKLHPKVFPVQVLRDVGTWAMRQDEELDRVLTLDEAYQP